MEETKPSKNKYWLWLTTAVFVVMQSLPVQAQTVLESIEETGVLKVAVREDAAPFGYLDSAKNLQGYCLDFLALLEEKLQQKLTRNTLAVKLLKSTASNRFQLIQQGSIDLECGPNTIRELSLSDVAFSRAFFNTETQFLIAKEQKDRIDLKGDLADTSIGVIRNTSSEQLMKESYPLARLVLFSGITARDRGVQAVEQGKIDAMVSDGILLQAEAAEQNLPIDEYILIPQNTGSFDNELFSNSDRYGMIIRGNDPQWQEFINSVISSQESRQLFKQWFDLVESFPQQSNN